MSKNIIGKFKLNKTTLIDGKEALLITGVAFPQDFDLDELSDGDEMWITNIEIKGETIKCSEPYNECSPEEFISGENQDLKSWKKQIKEDA